MEQFFVIAFVLNFLCHHAAGEKNVITVKGAGPERFASVINALMPAYHSYRDQLDPSTGVNFSYTYVNQSTAKAILLNSNVSSFEYLGTTYVITEAQLTLGEAISYPEIKALGITIGSLVFPFNLPGINELRLTSSIILQIFANVITRWDDASIKSLNPSLNLPAKPIKLILRLDKTEHTKLLTSCFNTLNPVLWFKYGIFDNSNMTADFGYSQSWKRSTNDTYFVRGPMGVASLTASIPYSLTYTHPLMATHWQLPVISTVYDPDLYITKTGQDIVALYNWTIETYMEKGTKNIIIPDRTNSSLIGTISYPFYYFNYVAFNTTISSSEYCRELAELVLFVNWVLGDPAARAMTMELDLIPLSMAAAQFFDTYIIKRLNCAGEKIYNTIETLMKSKDNDTTGAVLLVTDTSSTQLLVSLIVVVLLLGASGIAYKGYSLRKEVSSKTWYVTEQDLKVAESDTKSQISFHTLTSVGQFDNEEKALWDYHYHHSGCCQGRQAVLFKSGTTKNPLAYKYNTCRKLNFLLKNVHNANVVNFIGIAVKERNVYHAFENAGKHRLHDILASCPYDLNDDIKYSLAKDVALGMKYLHKQGLVHGLLDTWNVLLDNNWSAKIVNWAQCTVATAEGDIAPFLINETKQDAISDETYKRLLFRHPELLQGKVKEADPKHDLYSFSMITVEIFTRQLPYYETKRIAGGWRQVLETVTENGALPFLAIDIPNAVKNLQQHLIQKNPQMSFDGVVAYLTMHQPTKRGVVDTLLETMVQYMQNLEEKVEERTGELKIVTQKMENLLLSMLPPDVATKLQNGQSVEPEFYESVTVYFSDVVSFTTFCGESSPLDVIKFLNALYTLFDSIIERVDAYKVETIGDAYMCVSGLPRRNGDAHAEHIARMALALVDAMKTFEISHKSGEPIRIRVGINSGSVMAGVVGVKMPRYCLFGDTVNVASRMESTSLANRIQISDSTASLLKKTHRFNIESRGMLEVKGKGLMTTWWLNGVI